VPLFAVAVLATPYVGKFLNIENNFTLLLIWLSIFLSFFAAINVGVLSGWQKFKDISFSGIWGAVAKLIAGMVLVKVGFAFLPLLLFCREPFFDIMACLFYYMRR
jgi:hypothetical protein